ncbi:hypothetical protein Tco_0347944 [Tanacetum coccineum]
MKDIDWEKVKITDEVLEYVILKYGKCNWREDNSWSQIIVEDIYNTFYKDEAEADEEVELAKESEDMSLSIMKEKFLSMIESEKATVKDYTKLVVTDEMIDYTSFIDDKGRGKVDDKGKGKVDDVQNRVERLEGDLARAEKGKAKRIIFEKGKAKQAEDDVDLVDALDLEHRIKKLSEDFNRLLKAKKAKEKKKAEEAELKVKKEVVEVSSDEKDSSDEEVVEIRMFKERPTTSRTPNAFISTRLRTSTAFTRSRAPTTSTRSRAPIASTSSAQAASTAPTCVLALRAPNDPNAPPPSTTQKRKP